MPHHMQGHVLGVPMVQPRSTSMQPYMVGSNNALPPMPGPQGVMPPPMPGGPLSHPPAGSFAGSGNVGNMPGPSKPGFQPSGRGSTPPPRRSGSDHLCAMMRRSLSRLLGQEGGCEEICLKNCGRARNRFAGLHTENWRSLLSPKTGSGQDLPVELTL